ncbi:hypothetical protein RRG08_061229 [Elysia crispata]|uniref:Uncharacterized protein n=1 Tax=Elysia crispata TaxID=231223 RepID=A0AAE0ZG84_9GAST|nr:hypothetical protein RRG08_061229 [Elysia crispata]
MTRALSTAVQDQEKTWHPGAYHKEALKTENFTDCLLEATQKPNLATDEGQRRATVRLGDQGNLLTPNMDTLCVRTRGAPELCAREGPSGD